jgi:hypothetical protein
MTTGFYDLPASNSETEYNISYQRKKKPLLNKCQLNCEVFKMSFTADEYCNMYLGLGDAAFSCTMRFPNGRHSSENVIRRFDQRLREKNVTMTTTYGIFSYLLHCCHFKSFSHSENFFLN